MSEGNARIESPTPAVPVEQVKVDDEQQKRIQALLRASRLMVWVLLVPILVVEVPGLLLFLRPLYIAVMTNPWLMLQPVPAWYPLRVLIIYLFVVIFFLMLFSPIPLTLGYILPQRYKLQRFTFSAWMRRWLRAVGRLIVNWLCLVQCFFLFLLFSRISGGCGWRYCLRSFRSPARILLLSMHFVV